MTAERWTSYADLSFIYYIPDGWSFAADLNGLVNERWALSRKTSEIVGEPLGERSQNQTTEAKVEMQLFEKILTPEKSLLQIVSWKIAFIFWNLEKQHEI